MVSGAAFALGYVGFGGWVMVLGASFDLFDGRVARALDRVTLAGGYIDSCMDRVSEGLTLFGIAYLYRNTHGFWVVMVVFLASQLTSYCKAKGETMGIDYNGGMMQRPERIAYLGGGAILTPMIAYFLYPLLPPYFQGVSYLAFEGYVYLVPLGFVAVMATQTSVNRIVNIMKLLDKKQYGS